MSARLVTVTDELAALAERLRRDEPAPTSPTAGRCG